MRIFVIGGSGGVGRAIAAEAPARGHQITAQTRHTGGAPEGSAIEEAVGEPTDAAFLERAMAGHDGVIFALGVDHFRQTTLFSDTTRAAIAAMRKAGIARLVAITGIGTGETRGHGGWFYNRVIFPLFTRNRYADKELMEALIEESGLDWTIVRPAPFAGRAPAEPLQILLTVPADVQLTAVTRAEVAGFLLDAIETGQYRHQKPFIGHG